MPDVRLTPYSGAVVLKEDLQSLAGVSPPQVAGAGAGAGADSAGEVELSDDVAGTDPLSDSAKIL